MGIIRTLEASLANLIAAGEVVENVRSVMKELIENSLDAHAQTITVELFEGGLKKIVITDDGDGMDEDDLRLSIERHATSKLKTADDLFHVASLGFRGEALASLAAVAKLTIRSSPTQAPSKELTLENKTIKIHSSFAFKGTQVIVEDLFYATPARLKYLKNPVQEYNGVYKEMAHFCVAHPDVAFTFKHDGKTMLQTPGDGQIEKALYALYGRDFYTQMWAFEGQNRDYQIKGFMAPPYLHRSTSDQIHLFINGRSIRNTVILQAIKRAFADYQPAAKFPLGICMIEADPILVDVNVHPQKRIVKLAEEKALAELIETQLKEALIHQSISKRMARAPEIQPEQFAFEAFHETPIVLNEEGLDKSARSFPVLEYVGQIHGTYLVYQGQEGFYLLDQHAAAERIRYEKYYHHMQTDQTLRQPLGVPLSVPLTPLESSLLIPHLSLFETYGLQVKLEENTLWIYEVPHWFHPGLEEAYALTMVENLNQETPLEKGTLINQMAKDLACKHSLKGNQYVDASNAMILIDQLRKCQNPFHCPHGRPTLIHYSKASLENMFGRSMT
jgi:DNA mismatch repair protein MutL